MESEEIESHSSQHSAEDTNGLDLNKVYRNLLRRQTRLTSLLVKYHKLEENNLVSKESNSEGGLLKFKTRFLNQLLNQIKSQHAQQLGMHFPSHAQFCVKKTLEEELENVKALVIEKKKKLQEHRKCHAELEENIKNFEEMADNFNRIAAEHEEYSVKRIANRLNRIFIQYKEQLNQMLEELLPIGMKDLLQELCEAYFKDDVGDPYITVQETDECYKYVEALLLSCIVTRHPHNGNKIRLTHFFQ